MTNRSHGVRIYNLFPLLAGPIESWTPHLDRIAAMAFNWVYVNPLHLPGASGSLYSVKDYYRFHPLVQGDSKKSADELLAEFTAAAADRGIKVMMDLVLNHTGIDSVPTESHPEWFVRNHDGSLVSPSAIDPADARKRTVWSDLAEIDYSDRPERAAVVGYFANLVDHAVRLGVRGFRCDAAYKVPAVVWQPIIAAGREAADGTVFLAETLGARLEEVDGLRDAGFDLIYNSAKWWDFREGWLLEQYDRFRSIAPSVAFPETHDTARLIADLRDTGIGAKKAVELRYRRAWMFSSVFSAGVMMPVGFEFGFKRRLHVVETRPEHWEKPAFDLTQFIGEVNRMKADVPALNEESPQRAVHLGDGGRVLVLLRRRDGAGDWVVTVVNIDGDAPATVHRLEYLEGDIREGREVTPGRAGGPFHVDHAVDLAPAEVRVFAGG